MKLIVILIFLTGCLVYPGMKKRAFAYSLGRNKDIVFYVPSGYKNEQVKIGPEGGIEQFYDYPSGAYLYIAHKTGWDSQNQPFITASTPLKIEPNEFMYMGVDTKGLHWKEIRVDSLKFGYSYVPVGALAKFEQAINAIRIKRQEANPH